MKPELQSWKLSVAIVAALTLFAVVARGAQESAPLRYERVVATAKLYNVPSRNGAVVSELIPGTLVAVYAERAGYLNVEVPGGMGVWIYGKYVRETGEPGVLEITAQNINMRPLPTSDVSSFPLKEKLHRGDRVRTITRANPDRELASDWVKVWSPPGTRAWLPEGSTERVPASEDGRKLWISAVTAASAARPASSATSSSSASAQRTATAAPASATAPDARAVTQSPSSSQGATNASAAEAMARGEAQMAAIRAGTSTDFEGARRSYEAVLAAAPQSVDAGIARARLDELGAREDVVRLEADMRAFEDRRREEVARAQAELASMNARKDPLWGRFQARGWLERETRSPDEVAYVIRWAGKVTTEIICSSGRYDLDLFEGYEVGVTGVTTRAPIEASLGRPARPVRIDASRIEVITGRAAR